MFAFETMDEARRHADALQANWTGVWVLVAARHYTASRDREAALRAALYDSATAAGFRLPDNEANDKRRARWDTVIRATETAAAAWRAEVEAGAVKAAAAAWEAHNDDERRVFVDDVPRWLRAHAFQRGPKP